MITAKADRYLQNENRKNVIQQGKDLFEIIKGNWNVKQFDNDHPLVVELACGKGEFTVGLAREYPCKNFIGVDIKGTRLWKGSTLAMEEGLKNVAFLRTQIQFLNQFFDKDEIDELWITFPDPRPKRREWKNRLTSPGFLERYKELVKEKGLIHLKTDNTELYLYTLTLLQNRSDIQLLTATEDFYASEHQNDHYGIKTHYEKLFSEKGEKIKYLKFHFLR